MKKIFTNDKFFLVMTLCAVLGSVIYLAISCLNMPSTYVVSKLPVLIRALCIIFLYSSYCKHSKNVMKGLMGALLMAQLLGSISFFSAIYLPCESVMMGINLAVSVALFVSHFIINSDHHSSPALIKLNQVLCVVYLLNIMVWNGLWVSAYPNLLCIIGCVMNVALNIGIVASVVCVESRLDAYRIEREANGYKAE